MEESGVLSPGTNRVFITLLLDVVQQGKLLGTGYSEGKAFRHVKLWISKAVESSVPNSRREKVKTSTAL